MSGSEWHLVDIAIVVVPIGMALLALAVAWGSTTTKQKSMTKDIVDLEKRMKESDDVREGLKVEYMTEKEHSHLCTTAALRFEAHVTKVVNAMGDNLLKKMTALINGGKT